MKKISFSLIIIILLSLLPFSHTAHAEIIPTISILGVTKDTKVTIETHNLPANRVFEVRLGLSGTKGINGVLAGSLNSGAGGTLIITCPIPTSLNDEDTIAVRLESTTGGYYAYNWFSNITFGTHEGATPIEQAVVSPIISPASVKEGVMVVMNAAGFPKNKEINVRMGKYGTNGVNGVFIKMVNSGEDGAFTEDFEIPQSLKAESKIAIRFEVADSTTAAYTWFENQTGGYGGTSGDEDYTETYTGIPTITILSVNEDKNVTLRTNNFPVEKEFKVLMGEMGTKGVNGIHITTINSGGGGSFTQTFDIPGALNGDYRIAIRLQTTDGVFYAYNWFYNNTTGDENTSNGAADSYTGIPTFSITSVVNDDKVTIKTNNFPANLDFKVLMGAMGTKGVNGNHITTINSGDGGIFIRTFDIPSSLKGEDRIAIRLESTSGGFYAYNWFYNTTTP